MAVLDKPSAVSFIFGGVYIFNGTGYVCITDQLDGEIELHFISLIIKV